jgi:hypothetical protein
MFMSDTNKNTGERKPLISLTQINKIIQNESNLVKTN